MLDKRRHQCFSTKVSHIIHCNTKKVNLRFSSIEDNSTLVVTRQNIGQHFHLSPAPTQLALYTLASKNLSQRCYRQNKQSGYLQKQFQGEWGSCMKVTFQTHMTQTFCVLLRIYNSFGHLVGLEGFQQILYTCIGKFSFVFVMAPSKIINIL